MPKTAQPITQEETDSVCNDLQRDGRATIALASAGPKKRATEILRAAAR